MNMKTPWNGATYDLFKSGLPRTLLPIGSPRPPEAGYGFFPLGLSIAPGLGAHRSASSASSPQPHPAAPVTSSCRPVAAEPLQGALWGPALVPLCLLCPGDLPPLTIAVATAVSGIYKVPSCKARHPPASAPSCPGPWHKPRAPLGRSLSPLLHQTHETSPPPGRSRRSHLPVWQPSQRRIRACSSCFAEVPKAPGKSAASPPHLPPA